MELTGLGAILAVPGANVKCECATPRRLDLN